MHIVCATDGNTVADLDRALEVDIVAGLAHVHGSHLLVVGDPVVGLLATLEALPLDRLLLLVVGLGVAGGRL